MTVFKESGKYYQHPLLLLPFQESLMHYYSNFEIKIFQEKQYGKSRYFKKIYNKGTVLMSREKIKTILQTVYFSPCRLNYI